MLKRSFLLLAIPGVLAAFPGESLMEYTREPGTVGTAAGWPEELKALVKTDSLVMAAVGPIADVRLYCAGDTAKLNGFLKDFAVVPDATLRVTLHPGRTTCTYRERANVAGEVLPVDWLLHLRELIPRRPDAAEFGDKKLFITVDIWLGGDVELEKLEVPSSLRLESSGELEGFVERHQKQQAAVTGEKGGDAPEKTREN